MLKKIDHHMLYMSNYKRREGSVSATNTNAQYFEKSPTISANLLQNNHNYNYTHTLKPLQDNNTRVSFKGFNVEKIPANLSGFMRESISRISGEQSKLYAKFITDFLDAAKFDENFRKRIGLSSEIAKTLNQDNLIKLPKMPLMQKFFEVLVSPITMFKDLAVLAADNSVGKKVLPSFYASIQETKKHDAIVQNYKNIIGLSNFIRIQENMYRMKAGLDPIQQGEKFLIPEDILKEKINTLRFKAVDPNKGQFSTKHMMLGNRFVSGGVYAVFLSNDAYNTTMRYSNDNQASEEQRASRAKQEFAKIGMNIYIQNILLSTFESQINKSMTNALLVSGITVAASEVIGRMLVGRPIFPSNKETLDKMEEKMQNKNGILASIGRLIAGDKRGRKQPELTPEPLVIIQNNFFENSITGLNTGSNDNKFNKLIGYTHNTPSFKGLSKIPYTFERTKLSEMLNFINKLDDNQAKMFREIISVSLQKNKSIGGKNIEGKTLNEILADTSIAEIPIGDSLTFTQRFINGILSPVFFVQKTFKSLLNTGKKITGKLHEITPEKLQEKTFRDYLDNRLKLDVWKQSPLTPDEKEIQIYKEFVERFKNKQLEINGVKNLLLTLEKRFKILGIDPKSNEAKNLEKAKKLLEQIMTRADGANHAEYDANKFSQLNINLARAISTIFLVTDSYNLTMQYSNDDNLEAVKTAKNRAVQEASRIASSAYIMAFTHSIMSKIYNGTLLGAFATCFMTSVASDSMARAVVGVPLTRKTHEELIEIDKKQQKEKNSVQKILAYLIGKR